MSFFSNLSLTKKLLSIIMLTSFVSLLIASTIFAVYEIHLSRSSTVNELKTMAGLIGTNSIASLEFNDPLAAEEIISALGKYKHVIHACLYDKNNIEFAHYYRSAKLDKRCEVLGGNYDEVFFSSGKIKVYLPIRFYNQKIGTVHILSESKEVSSRVYRYILISIAVLFISSIVAFLLSSKLQRLISNPILNLTETATTVSKDKDYSIRVPVTTTDEVGILVERFNEMLANIQQRDQALQEAQDELEGKVRERTKELQQAHQILKYHVENSPAAVIEWDKGFNVTRWSPQAEKIFKWKPEEVLGKHPYELKFVFEEDFQRVEIAMERLVKGIDSRNVLLNRNYTKHGEIVWCQWHNSVLLDEDGNLISILSIVLDITERYEAEEKLRRGEARLAESQRIAHLGNWEWNSGTKELWRSDEFYVILGTSRDEFEDTYGAFSSMVHPDDRSLVMDSFAQAIEKDQPYNIDYRIVRPDGSIRTINEQCEVAYQGANKTGLKGTIHDVTERISMQEEIRKTRNLESLGILAGGIAHDFNNLLVGIMGNVSYAKNHLDPDSKVYNRLDVVEKASIRAKDLTKQLLTFAKGGSPIKETFDIKELLRDITSFVLRGSNVKYEISITDALWAVDIDQSQISQAISNLIINADQAMPNGGIVEVSAENITIDDDSTTAPLDGGMYIRITIKDYGIGIPKDKIDKIFDPYFTTKEQGSGLGLTTCYSIVKKHGGYIGVESEEDKGTSFTIYLPASEKFRTVNDLKEEKLISGHGRILVMDDQEVVRDSLSYMLESLSYEVEMAKDGQEAFDLYKRSIQQDRPFNAVILDLTVPGGMGGLETIEKLLEVDPNVKAVVSSGYSTNPVMAEFEEYGFKDVVVKPYTTSELSQVLARVITG